MRLRILTVLTTLMFVSAGVVLAYIFAYPAYTDHRQHQSQSNLRHAFQSQTVAPNGTGGATHHRAITLPGEKSAVPVTNPVPVSLAPDGKGIAEIRIPRIGLDQIIVQGTTETDLTKGPGHIITTQMPGQVGNFVVSGHRTTWGKPFANIDKLRNGDSVFVITHTNVYRYIVYSTQVVLPNDLAVTAPVPNHPGHKATQANLTMTACTPKFSASHRIVVFATLK